MILLVGLFSVMHVTFYWILTRYWNRMQATQPLAQRPGISVVIPTRNESKVIAALLNDLSSQEYPLDKFEIIVVDDFSTDDTAQVVADYIKTSDLSITHHIQKAHKEQGKKYALTKAISLAKFEIILTTDSDCRVQRQWLSSMAAAFTDDIQIVAGPVRLEGKGCFSALQKMEFSGLVGFGAVTLSMNNPSMCSGANLAFKKAAFFAVGGYENNIHIPTGDDEFLLFDILSQYPKSGLFLKDYHAVVATPTHDSFGAFFNQRARWISKWKHNKNWKLRLIAILFFFDYGLFILAFYLAINQASLIWVVCLMVSLRWLSNYLYLKATTHFLRLNLTVWPFLLLQIFYPVHVFFMGLLSIFGRYTWKGRRY